MSKVLILENNTRTRSYPRNTRGRNSFETRRYYSNSKVYVFESGESILDNLENRRSRPSKAYREFVLQAHPELEGKIRWSQKAGCSCGCSPGFLVDHTVRVDGTPADIYITIGLAKEAPEDMSYVEMALA